jgi:uncharacterized membrane protein YebE (DUF533 family)
MKKLLVALCLTCVLALAAQAQDKPEAAKPEAKNPPPTAEQKAYRKTLVEKYDANKDGKLDKEERAKITKEEQDKAGYAPKKEKKAP